MKIKDIEDILDIINEINSQVNLTVNRNHIIYPAITIVPVGLSVERWYKLFSYLKNLKVYHERD